MRNTNYAYTNNGAVPFRAGVSEAKIDRVRELISATNRGDRVSAATLAEAVSTSDALFNFAHVLNLNLSVNWNVRDTPLAGDAIVGGTTPVSNFEEIVRYHLDLKFDEDGVLGSGDPYPVAPHVPEASPYPYAKFTGQSVEGANLRKFGFKFGWTWERFLADTIGVVRGLPEQLRQVALNTEDSRTWAALKSVSGTQGLTGGTNVEEQTVPANAPLSRDSLLLALDQRATRRDSRGHAIAFTGKDVLVVPSGKRLTAEFIINTLKLEGSTKNSRNLVVANGYDPLAGIEVVESPYVTGTQWYLVNVQNDGIHKIKLVGNETPELRISNFTGTYVGGGAVSGFEGSFDTDQADFRVRYPVESVLWEPNTVIWSTGAGS